jgi:hypothetical protein
MEKLIRKKPMHNSKFIIAIFFIFCTSMLIAGGGWPQPKGKGYFKLYSWWVIADQHYTDTGLIDPNVTSGFFNNGFYAEYGLTSRLTLIANVPVFSRAYMNNLRSSTTGEIISPGDAINSLGDIDLGFKFGLNKPGSKIALAASINFGLPTGEAAGGEAQNLQTGDGEFNQYLQLDAGTSFSLGKTPCYANLYVGANNRTKGYSDEFRYGIEMGAGLINQKLWITGRITGIESFYNGSTAASITSSSIFANNTEYTSIGGEVAYYVSDKVGFSLAVTGAFQGRIIFAAPSYSVGVFYHLK